MVNWTDPIIHWNQLGSTQLKRLIATWGKDAKAIAKYDRDHGLVHTPPKVEPPVTVKKTAKKTVTKTATPARVTRQKHTGADGEVKYVHHRDLYVGFFGGKVVVTKRTKEQCLEVLRTEYKLEV